MGQYSEISDAVMIESAFSSLKSRGLNLKATHMTAPDRISRWFGLLCVALAWLTRVGAHTVQESPPRQNHRGRVSQVLSQAVRWGGKACWVCVELLITPVPTARQGATVSYELRLNGL